MLPLDALDRLAPFLAVRMNGQPLTADHGAPVRLVVPGWYGCAWIKWVNEIALGRRRRAGHAQMLEFAFRTHQDGIPALARDYAEPAIDTAAMPVRVEQRRVDGRLGVPRRRHRLGRHAARWTGWSSASARAIRGTPFTICPAPRTHHTWSLWSYRWRPAEPGFYDIALRAADPAVRTRRLDLSFYIRRVRIDEI